MYEASPTSEPWDHPAPNPPRRYPVPQILVLTAVVFVLTAGGLAAVAAETATDASSIRDRAHAAHHERAALDRRYEAAVVQRELIMSRKAKVIEPFDALRDALIDAEMAHDEWMSVANTGVELFNAGKLAEAADAYRKSAEKLKRMQDAVAKLHAVMRELQAARRALEEKL